MSRAQPDRTSVEPHTCDGGRAIALCKPSQLTARSGPLRCVAEPGRYQLAVFRLRARRRPVAGYQGVSPSHHSASTLAVRAQRLFREREDYPSSVKCCPAGSRRPSPSRARACDAS